MGFLEERVKRMFVDIPYDVADEPPPARPLGSLSKTDRAKAEKLLAAKDEAARKVQAQK